jgi:aminopeptidase YwaD
MSQFSLSVLSLFFFLPSVLPPLSAQLVPNAPSTSTDITAADIRSHVEYLASDALEGRLAGSAALDSAAVYLAREFERHGLLPAGEEGFFQPMDIVTGMKRGNSELSVIIDGVATQLDTLVFIPDPSSRSGGFSGPPVFAGYGLSMPQSMHDDYAGLDAEGTVAIVLNGAPREMDAQDFTPLATSLFGKAFVAREAGVKALLVIDDQRTTSRSFVWDGHGSRAGLPVAYITREAAVGILLAAAIDTSVLGSARPTRARERNVTIHGVISVDFVRSTTWNVVAYLPGDDNALAEETLVIGAHYDHLGRGKAGSLYRGEEARIHYGADDNASGTAGLLELAEFFSAQPPARSLLFIAFTAEETGLLGSAHWVANPALPLDRIVAMINLDMIGRLPDSTRRLIVQGVGTSPVWSDLLTTVNKDFIFDLSLVQEGLGGSDHASFYRKGIPVLFFFTGLHADYHRPTDVAEKVNYEGLEQILSFVAELIRSLDNMDAPAFSTVNTRATRSVPGFSVYVGVLPDYGWDGSGFRISGTGPDSPAEKAGMLEGDIIIKIGETRIVDIYDYMNALGKLKPGDGVPFLLKRGKNEVEVSVDISGR